MSCTKKITSNLLNYFHQQIPNFHAVETKYEALCFREKLDIHCKNDRYKKSIGDYSISVERVGPKAQAFLVSVYSSMSTDGYVGKLDVLSIVNGELQFLEEKRNERFENSDGLYKKYLYLGLEETCYSVKSIQESHKEKNSNSFDLTHEENNYLLSEGSNILLMRYLALNNFIGDLNLQFITIEGKIVTCNYECLGMKKSRINNKKIMNIYRIKQILSNGDVYNENIICLTKKGRILKIDWLNTPYELKVNFLLDPLICSHDPIIIPLLGIWNKDVELMSQYKDKQMDEIYKQNHYLLHHPEVENIVGDYINNLLNRKPEDVLMFTIEYFKSLPPTENLHDIVIEKESATMTSKYTFDTFKTNNGPDGKECIS